MTDPSGTLRPKETFGDILSRNNGIGPGFDFARITLAIAVLAYHCPEVVYGGQYETSHQRTFWVFRISVLPMFFGLSGFLVAGSAKRLDLKNFMINRGFRIVPALAVEIVLSALVLGPILTSLSLRQYFSDPILYTYFANLLGAIHFKLPGVFLDNPFREVVNASLWTVPHEVLCYFVMAIIIVLSLQSRLISLFGLLLVWVIVGTIIESKFAGHAPNSIVGAVYSRYAGDGRGPVLVPCFLLGVIAYRLRSTIPHSWLLLWSCVVGVVVTGTVFDSDIWKWLPLSVPISAAMVYIVCFVGLTRMPALPVFSRGDYSYGIYLYHFPILQTLLYCFHPLHNVALLFVTSLIASTLFAMLSWHGIEKPLLKLRKSLSMARRFDGPAELEVPVPLDARPPQVREDLDPPGSVPLSTMKS